MARAFVGVGSNIDPRRNVRRALRLLARRAQVRGISTVYRTRPLGPAGAEAAPPAQPPFYNCVVEIETDIPSGELRQALRSIEAALGRERTADKYAPRTIDLDLLLYDALVVAGDEMVLPDPQIAQRPFLALPLYELAPDLTLPGSGQPIRDLAAALGAPDMEKLDEYTRLLRKDLEHGP